MAEWSSSLSDDFCRVMWKDLEDIHKLGSGGYGIVYKAKHKIWSIDVAVKCLLPNYNESAQENLLDEARKMRRAQFSFVLPVRGTLLEKDNLGIVMEFMPYGSIAGLLGSLEPPWSLRFRLLNEVALAMNYLHSLVPPLLHLDLKPQNVLLDGDLHAKVADFGLSKFRKTDESSLCNKSLLGTQEYMPPESLSNINHHPNTAFDVYSYAILIWTMLTGQTPYEHAHPSLIRLLVIEGQRPDKKMIPNINLAEITEYVDLMQLCWDGDHLSRPSFRVILEKTQAIFEKHKSHLHSDVLTVKNILERMAHGALNVKPVLGSQEDSWMGQDLPCTLRDSQVMEEELNSSRCSGMTQSQLSEKLKSCHISEEETMPAVGRPQIRDIGTPHVETRGHTTVTDPPFQQRRVGESFAKPEAQTPFHRQEEGRNPSDTRANQVQPQAAQAEPAEKPHNPNYVDSGFQRPYMPTHPQYQAAGQYHHPTSDWRGTTKPGETPPHDTAPMHHQYHFPSPMPYYPAHQGPQPAIHPFSIIGSTLTNVQIGNNNKIMYEDNSRRHAPGDKQNQV